MRERRIHAKEFWRSIRISSRVPLKEHPMKHHALTPPFEIYDTCHIRDAEGHICTADDPGVAQALVLLLNRTKIPVSPEKPVLTPERVLDWIEISLLRVRDSEKKLAASNVPTVRVLTQICEHIANFRKEFRDHG